MSLRILQIDVPRRDLDRATAFWAAALSATPTDAPGAFVHLVGATSALEVHVQETGGDRPGYHLDLESDHRHAEVARLLEHGARQVARFDAGYTVLEDPAGLQLCIIDPDAAVPTPVAPRVGTLGYLDAVFLDVPADRVDLEVAFWASALAADAVVRDDPMSPYTTLTGVRGPGGPAAVEVQVIGGPARMHVDLSAPDVGAEAVRLERLGATRVAEISTWIVLADPAGNLLCVVPSERILT